MPARMAKTKIAPGYRMRAIPNLNLRAAVPWAVDDAVLQKFARGVLASPAARGVLSRDRWRVLSGAPVAREDKAAPPTRPRDWTVTAFDYERNATVRITARFPTAEVLDLDVRGEQPLPSYEEWRDAVSILERHDRLGPAMRAGRLRPYRPMPP